jgi:hypothetical protein
MEKIPSLAITNQEARKILYRIFHIPIFVFDNMENMKKQQEFELEPAQHTNRIPAGMYRSWGLSPEI